MLAKQQASHNRLSNLAKNRKKNRTYPADCRKIAAVDTNKHDWD